MKKMSAVFLALFAVNASAANKLPTDLMYLDKPIDALCFSAAEKSDTIDLRDCGYLKEKYTVKGQNADLLKKGYTGYNWQDNREASFQPQGYSYYKAFDAGNKQFWIYSINGTGGSGDFTAIQSVKRTDPDTLATKVIISGDRCNGGIQDVSEKGRQLIFSANLTAFDLLPLADSNPHNLKAYDDLAACAVCCTAKAFYEIGSDEKLNFKYVELDKVTKTEEMSTQGTHQACFNKLFASYVKKGETKLNETKLKKFVNEFNATCVK